MYEFCHLCVNCCLSDFMSVSSPRTEGEYWNSLNSVLNTLYVIPVFGLLDIGIISLAAICIPLRECVYVLVVLVTLYTPDYIQS